MLLHSLFFHDFIIASIETDQIVLALTISKYQREYLIVNNITTMRADHDDFCIRFASAVNQVTAIPVKNLIL